MASGGLIEFQTGPIADIGRQTLNQQQQWDSIWESTRARISATAAEALDVATGSSLQQRSDEYHRKSVLYTQNVGQQGQAVNQIGTIASETNAQMVSTIRGAGS
jgi:hypothetical protein